MTEQFVELLPKLLSTLLYMTVVSML